MTDHKKECLTLEQLKQMDDQIVSIYLDDGNLKINALVAYRTEGEGTEDDGNDVWLTNNLGGRSTYQSVLALGGAVYRHQIAHDDDCKRNYTTCICLMCEKDCDLCCDRSDDCPLGHCPDYTPEN